ncbi:MAG TPA: hypothetical protein VHX90_07600 [Verrucomicrobiae bacterium]|jgi:hypothetical protein|nr:hypothetical protein [Verrucomicrobiae bacterium]
MHRLLMILLLLGSLSATFASDIATGRIVKVLPLLLDAKNQDAISPSLYDRDAYQAYLRQHTNEISAVRYDILWKASNVGDTKLKLRIELRGVDTNNLPRQTMLEQEVKPKYFRQWTSLKLEGADYKNFGTITCWRATLWSGDQMLGEQKSFLW